MKRFQVITLIALAAIACVAYAYDPVTTAAILPGLADPAALGMTALAIGATNFVQAGETVTLTAPYTVVSGAGAKVGHIFGVALTDIANGVAGEFATCGVWDLLAASADTIAQGAPVYWDNGNKQCDSSSTGNSLIGVALVAKAGGETTVRVRLDGVSV